MPASFYENINHYFISRPGLSRALCAVNSAITLAVFLSYPVLIVFLAFTGRPVIKIIAVPALSFIILSWFRKIISSPRPYEVYQVRALNKKDTRGNGFPSRHVFSCFLIGMVFYEAGAQELSSVILAGAVLLCILRVLIGVHFIKDVLAGAACGLLAGGILIIL